MINPHGPLWEPGQHLKLTAERRHNLLQRRNLHVGLLFQLRETRLLNAEQVRELLLTLAVQAPDFAQQELAEQFLGSARRLGAGPLVCGLLNEFVERFGHLNSPAVSAGL